MKYYSDYTIQYVKDICDALNEAEIYKKLSPHDEHANRPFAPENFLTLTNFLQKYVVIPININTYLNNKGLVNRGRCPYTGEKIDNSAPKWTYMNNRSIYTSSSGIDIMEKEHDEEYEKIVGHPPRKPKSGGCYIATVCYGNESASEVMILKSYRDEVLSKSYFGNMFIKFYYYFSPSVAKYLQNKRMINKFIRTKILDKIVEKVRKRLY